MSKTSMSITIPNYKPKDNKEEKESKQKLLQKQFLAKTKQVSSNTIIDKNTSSVNSTIEKDETEYLSQINSLNNKLENSKKDIAFLKKEIKELKKDKDKLSLISNELKKAKTEIYNFNNLISEKDSIVEKLTTRNSKLEIKITELKSESDREIELTTKNEELEKANLKLWEQNKSYFDANKKLKEKIEEYKAKLEIKESFQTQLDNKNLQAENLKLTTQFSDLNKLYQSTLLKNKSLQDVLESYENKQDFNIKNIFRRIKVRFNTIIQGFKTKTIEKVQKSKIFKKDIDIKLLEKENIQYGYITKNKINQFIFISTANKKYFIKSSSSTHELEADLPAQAYITQNLVHILKIYKNIDALKSDENNFYKSLKRDSKTKEVILKLTENITNEAYDKFTILIIGSRFKTKYIKGLRGKGIKNIVWHNPYEESYQRLDDKLSYSDVVIVCTSHTSHFSLDHIDNKSDNRFQLIERDSIDNIYARIRFSLITRGLL